MAKRSFSPRHFMEKSIEVMRLSVAESRIDGKACPRVGAVLVDIGDEAPSKSRVEFAYRGELREGDHAEFTLLERKNRDRKLDDCVLFATLEPCAKGSRKHPKMSCAERIVSARIKQVWVGIEDPDPTVDRKGIKYLQDHGVAVHMFDRDLQEIIREENKEFISQAVQRAATAAEAEPRDIALSPWESALANSRIEDFSSKALELYRSQARIADEINSMEFNRRLVLQGLLQFVNDRFVPTAFGMLLFGAEPRIAMPQAGLLATVQYSDGTEEVHDFDGPQVLVPDELLRWLEGKLRNVIDRSQATRQRKNDSLFELVREGTVNALVHRDYSVAEAKIQFVVSANKIEIRSPGEPVSPITLEQMKSFDAPLLSRNPLLHYVFAKLEMAEERGLGLKSMREHASNADLPLPRYSWVAPYLILTLFPDRAATTMTLPSQVLEKLSENERSGWQWLTTRGRAKSADYARANSIDARTARRHMSRFVELGLARSVGSGPSTEYEVV